MKKSIVMLLLTITVLSLSACASGKETDKKENVKQEAVDENAKDKEELNEHVNEEEKKDDIDNEEDNVTEDTKKISVNVYRFNPDDETFVVETKECDELSEQNIWSLLKETTSIPADSNVNSFKMNGDQLELDVDHAFGEKLRSYGTSGEDALMGCVVNTYLDAYKCSSIKITEDGQTLCSGHREYTEYLTKY
ncbi:GerMN domain-containing protein [Phocaeicola sp.]|uniref:GerMN domain-containing protein n=1 Tax=Phocaeicola sp. TaxID=2773926 RepID=UPI003AF0EB29